MHPSIKIATILFTFYDILEAHLVDIHPWNAEEHMMMEEADRQKENREARETLYDESLSEEERRKALRTLYENGGMV